LLEKILSLGLGMAVASKEQIEKFVEEMVSKGELNKAESMRIVEDLIRKGKEAQATLEDKAKNYALQALRGMNLTTKEDYAQLMRRIEELERRVAALEGKDSGANPAAPPAP